MTRPQRVILVGFVLLAVEFTGIAIAVMVINRKPRTVSLPPTLICMPADSVPGHIPVSDPPASVCTTIRSQ